jgi:hypothetical protein
MMPTELSESVLEEKTINIDEFKKRVKILVLNGANTEVRNKSGKTLLECLQNHNKDGENNAEIELIRLNLSMFANNYSISSTYISALTHSSPCVQQ